MKKSRLVVAFIIAGLLLGSCGVCLLCSGYLGIIGGDLSEIMGGGIQRGAVPPDFSLQATDGQVHTLSAYRGEVVLVNFWAAWCQPCREEMPALESGYLAHRDEGFVILAINTGDSFGDVYRFGSEQGLSFPLLVDEQEIVADAYRVQALPTSFLVDGEGLVYTVHFGSMSAEQLEAYLVELLH